MKKLIAVIFLIGCSDNEYCTATVNDDIDYDAAHMCADNLTHQFRASNQFNIEQHAAMYTAVMDWNNKTGGRTALDYIIVDKDPDIFFVDYITVHGYQEGKKIPFQMATFKDNHIEIRSDTTIDIFMPGFKHEVGHFIGLSHHGTYQIMTKVLTSYNIEQADIDLFNKIYAKGLK